MIGTVSEPQKFLLVEKLRDELRLLQLQDQSVGLILKAKDKNEKPSSSQIEGMSMTIHRLAQLWDRLKVQDGLPWRQIKTEDLVAVGGAFHFEGRNYARNPRRSY